MKSTDEITNSQDIIDSRDVIARIEELRGQLDACVDAITSAENDEDRDQASEDLADWLNCTVDQLPQDLGLFADLSRLHKSGYSFGSDELRELDQLEQLASECEGYGDWNHGETLIRDSYFREYAEEMAEDIGAIDRSAGWPACHIDWDAAADALKMDYTSVTFDGVEYWMHS